MIEYGEFGFLEIAIILEDISKCQPRLGFGLPSYLKFGLIVLVQAAKLKILVDKT